MKNYIQIFQMANQEKCNIFEIEDDFTILNIERIKENEQIGNESFRLIQNLFIEIYFFYIYIACPLNQLTEESK